MMVKPRYLHFCLQVQRLCSAMVSSKPPAGKEFDLQQEQIFFVKVGSGRDRHAELCSNQLSMLLCKLHVCSSQLCIFQQSAAAAAVALLSVLLHTVGYAHASLYSQGDATAAACRKAHLSCSLLTWQLNVQQMLRLQQRLQPHQPLQQLLRTPQHGTTAAAPATLLQMLPHNQKQQQMKSSCWTLL
jgi:hypothetical protein